MLVQLIAAAQRWWVKWVERMRHVRLFGVQAGQVLVRTVADAVHQSKEDFAWAGYIRVHGCHPCDPTAVSLMRLPRSAATGEWLERTVLGMSGLQGSHRPRSRR